MKGKAGIALLLAAAGAAFAVAASSAATDAARGPQAAAAPDRTVITCSRSRALSIGLAAPITGAAASLGQQQRSWARFLVTRWNATHRRGYKIRLVEGDTQLPNAAEAIRVANNFRAQSAVLGVAGPAGSQEVQDSTSAYRAGGLAFVSGSATRTSLTDGTRRNFFFRVVPTDAQQGANVARYIINTLKARRVHIIDDQEAYGQGLSDEVQRRLNTAGVNVSRDSVAARTSSFAGQISKIGTDVRVVYIPWQISSDAQAFGQQLRAAGRSAIIFGSDGLFDPDNFKIAGSYISFFPVARTSPIINAYKRSHNGKPEFFGAPTYEAVHVLAQAIQLGCANGSITRAEVRTRLRQVRFTAKQTLLGIPIRFGRNGDIAGGRFGIFRIANNGAYNPVG
jgi:branched-chain amino acid transport system substrate-binding protein